jgi:integrase
LHSLIASILTPRPTFAELSAAWLSAAERRCSPGYVRDARRALRVELASLAPLRADKITRQNVAGLLATIQAPGVANRAHAIVSSVYGWAMSVGRHEGANPCTGLRKRPLQPRERVLNDAEIAALWVACANAGDAGRIVRLLLCTGCRRQEIGGLQWSEVDREAAQLNLPPARMKAGRGHTVPLTRLALDQVPPEREGFPHVFGKVAGCGFSGWSRAKRHLDRQLIGMAPWNYHCLRRTVATRMGDLGIADDVVERLLAHAPQGVTRRYYNRSTKLAEQRAALERWADELRRQVI